MYIRGPRHVMLILLFSTQFHNILTPRTVRDRLQNLDRNWNPASVASVTMDFESAMWQACRSVLPSSRLQGCNFHWAQAIWRHVQSSGLQSDYENNAVIRSRIRLIFGLPFLPSNYIGATFQYLYNFAATGELRTLFDYVRDTWVSGDHWEPNDWCVYGRFIRTNNDVEGWHHRLNNNAQQVNLPFYLLVTLLLKESDLVKKKQPFVLAGRYPKHQTRKTIRMNNTVARLWSEFREGRITPLQLLSRSAYACGASMRR